jgi:hypothetical protein
VPYLPLPELQKRAEYRTAGREQLMSNRLPFIGVIVAIVLVPDLWSSIFVVNERQQAIVLRFGEIVDVETEPGIYFKAPFRCSRPTTCSHRGPHAALRPRRHPRPGFGRPFYEVDAFVAYAHQRRPQVPLETVSGSVERPRTAPAHPSSTRPCAGSTVCVVSSRRCRKSAPR